MKPEIENILQKIEDNGFEAYVIGGYVRDKLLGIESFDVDIVTNALPKDLINIFNVNSRRTTLYGTMKLLSDRYRFDIATYRKELSYLGRKPETIEYIQDLKEDILRRDFTINTIAMNKNGIIIDYLGAIKDLQNKVIKCVGDPNTKFKEDPLRILRAIRFSIILDFTLDNILMNSLKKNIDLIKSLPSTRVKEELSRILVSKNVISGLDFMKKLNVLKLLNISYDNIVYVDDLLGMYAQLNLDDNYPFTKEEKRNIEIVKAIVKSKKINNITLFNYGLYLSIVAGKIMQIDPEEIITINNNLPIKEKKDLKISYNDIVTILNINSTIVKNIMNDIINKVLLNELNNDKEELILYIINHKKEYI
ncbi:MAG: hypothetical protein IJ572_05175 [Bacilli bacterium]|nr:hypothetical protein [Bacilli bacterium]